MAEILIVEDEEPISNLIKMKFEKGRIINADRLLTVTRQPTAWKKIIMI